MEDVEALFQSITGTEMAKYYRPPQGKFSTENMKMAQSMGYQTFFFPVFRFNCTCLRIFTYLSYYIFMQCFVIKICTEILDELLTKWEEMGYTIKPLSEIS